MRYGRSQSKLPQLQELMRETDITALHFTFDGSGDSGDVTLSTIKRKQATSDQQKANAVYGAMKLEDKSLNELAETVAYELLENGHGGWEINEGSHGSIVIPASGNPTIDYNPNPPDYDDYNDGD